MVDEIKHKPEIAISSHTNSHGEKISLENRTFSGNPVICLVIYDDMPPRGSGMPAPMLFDEGTQRWIMGELSKMRGAWDADDLAELHRMIPDLNAVLTHNPIHKVYFRAGLLACREYMARFVEQGGSDIEKQIGQSIRANWWTSLGDDPGPPRKLSYQEVADEKPDGHIDHKKMSPSVEALPIASAFVGAKP